MIRADPLWQALRDPDERSLFRRREDAAMISNVGGG